MSIQLLIRKADDLFRNYMKMKWGAPEQIECHTCHGFFRYDLIDLGHIIPRIRYATRWNEGNVVPQCIECNRNNSGSGVMDHIDDKTLTELRLLAQDSSFRLSRDFLNSIIETYGNTQ